jgi:hypothetical protein
VTYSRFVIKMTRGEIVVYAKNEEWARTLVKYKADCGERSGVNGLLVRDMGAILSVKAEAPRPYGR